ncbi:3-hydroxyacyl-CoA dehydrogenase NAD-binding domain-containing protein [Sphingomonas bacterium]|uniref:3-hydroxyacyl-CoA dehydrogenase NAD-binding domain-containing protein n=1 Tax=Sphingomonas bacterium TaxID=1895847 RepID=UPI001576CDF9|nr:3-hydroxyacyl-CoA dehydrogenase NAD-binding domain-containing protein [Sphingomonas bacterium]
MADFTMTVGADGVAVILFDCTTRTMNTLTAAGWDALAALVEQVKADPAIRGAVIASGKDNGFCAGADLGEMMDYAGVRPADETAQRAVFDTLFKANRVARAVETCGKPVAAAIGGLALGGGLELALACHHRVVADDPAIRLGLPEATIGLLPGGGGTQRVGRLLGIARAMPLLQEGATLNPARALELGLIDAIVAKGEELDAAKAWVLADGDPVAPWDRKDFALPGGGPYSESGNAEFIAAAAGVAKSGLGNYPARMNIARAVYEGVQVPMDAAIVIETRYFVATLQTPAARAMIRTQFGSLPALRRGESRPAGIERGPLRKVAVLGAGMMGAGIAHVLAKAGIETVLIDVSVEAAQKGKAYSTKLLDRLVAKGTTSRESAGTLLERIRPSGDYAAVTGSDAVIETVFEDVSVKAEATAKALAHLGPDALFATNTSTLPIGRLAVAHPDPSRFIGMHFHSPVDRMELVEVVIGEATGQAAIAQALDLVRQIGKTAILAHDSPFFYTSRVFDTYIREGMEMLADGIAPLMIDHVGRLTGMPRGPLELTDDVAIDLVDRIARQRHLLLGDAADRRRSDDVVDMLMAAGRLGRKNGRGFYDYDASGSKRVWSGLGERWPVTVASSSPELIGEMRRRFLHRQAVEAARCLAEGVLDDPRHADVGAILGWGFPRWTGGPVSYIEQIGIGRFVEECDVLSALLGERFSAPESLRNMVRNRTRFYTPNSVLRRAYGRNQNLVSLGHGHCGTD